MSPYERKARLYPALLVLIPPALGVANWAPADFGLPWAGATALATLVVGSLLAQLARDGGRKREPFLYRRWGGKPSVLALSYSSGVFGPTTLRRYHRILGRESGLALPRDEEAERSRPQIASKQYEAANDYLLDRTRDRNLFPLVHEELANYGFRRNLWAMKPAGVVLALFGSALGAAGLYFHPCAPLWTCQEDLLTIACGATSLLLWLVVITPDWVKVAADAYAVQIVRAADRIEGS